MIVDTNGPAGRPAQPHGDRLGHHGLGGPTALPALRDAGTCRARDCRQEAFPLPNRPLALACPGARRGPRRLSRLGSAGGETLGGRHADEAVAPAPPSRVVLLRAAFPLPLVLAARARPATPRHVCVGVARQLAVARHASMDPAPPRGPSARALR